MIGELPPVIGDQLRPLFCRELDGFVQVTKFKPRIFGWRSVRQTSFVARLCLGGSPHLATLDRYREWMREQVDANDRWAIRNAVAVKSANGAGEYAYPAFLLESLPGWRMNSFDKLALS